MPWNDALQLEQRPASFASLEQWVSEARLAESDGGNGFVVRLERGQVVAWNLREAQRDVESMTLSAQLCTADSDRFGGARDAFLTCIAKSRNRFKAYRASPYLARDRALQIPLTSRRILEIAADLDLCVSASTHPRDQSNQAVATWVAHTARLAPAAAPVPALQDHHVLHWDRFVQWCETSDVSSLPATSETVADHLRSLAKSYTISTIWRARAAISEMHRISRFEDPCATERVRTTIKDLKAARGKRKRIWRACDDASTPGMLEAIRNTACVPRKHKGCEKESEGAARQRGLVDIALHSLLGETRLGFSTLAKLKWEDLSRLDDGGAEISIREDSAASAERIRISESTKRDLDSIAEFAGLDGRIFPFGEPWLRRRLKSAIAAAKSRIAV